MCLYKEEEPGGAAERPPLVSLERGMRVGSDRPHVSPVVAQQPYTFLRSFYDTRPTDFLFFFSFLNFVFLYSEAKLETSKRSPHKS